MFKLNKMNFFDCFVIFIMGFFVMFYVKEQYTEVEYVKSDIDNKEYLVKVNEYDLKHQIKLRKCMQI